LENLGLRHSGWAVIRIVTAAAFILMRIIVMMIIIAMVLTFKRGLRGRFTWFRMVALAVVNDSTTAIGITFMYWVQFSSLMLFLVSTAQAGN
jgi:low affinity Fe/Cu permease